MATVETDQDPVVAQAWAILANAIGDRDGLASLGDLFDSIDTDGNGELDSEEFRVALNNFGLELSATETQRVFASLDTDGGGTIDFEEFSAIAKNQLELAALKEEIGGDASGETIDAVKAGVRLTRTASTQFDVKQQGDLAMLTAEALAEREQLKENAQVLQAVRSWWDGLKIKVQGGLQMDQSSYLIFSTSLHRHFMPEVEAEDALAAANRDWAEDCPKGNETMRFTDFYNSVFELCDLWADGTNAHDYEHLIRIFEATHKAGEEAELRRREEEAQAALTAARQAALEAVQRALYHAKMAASAAKRASKAADKACAEGQKKFKNAMRRAMLAGEAKRKAFEVSQRAADAARRAVEVMDSKIVETIQKHAVNAANGAAAAAAAAERAVTNTLIALAAVVAQAAAYAASTCSSKALKAAAEAEMKEFAADCAQEAAEMASNATAVADAAVQAMANMLKMASAAAKGAASIAIAAAAVSLQVAMAAESFAFEAANGLVTVLAKASAAALAAAVAARDFAAAAIAAANEAEGASKKAAGEAATMAIAAAAAADKGAAAANEGAAAAESAVKHAAADAATVAKSAALLAAEVAKAATSAVATARATLGAAASAVAAASAAATTAQNAAAAAAVWVINGVAAEIARNAAAAAKRAAIAASPTAAAAKKAACDAAQAAMGAMFAAADCTAEIRCAATNAAHSASCAARGAAAAAAAAALSAALMFAASEANAKSLAANAARSAAREAIHAAFSSQKQAKLAMDTAARAKAMAQEASHDAAWIASQASLSIKRTLADNLSLCINPPPPPHLCPTEVAAAAASIAARMAATAERVATAALKLALQRIKEAQLDAMWNAMQKIWILNKVELQRWQTSGNRCPSCALKRLLDGKGFDPTASAQIWPEKLLWLSECMCDPKKYCGKYGLSAKEWAKAWAGLPFAEFFNLVRPLLYDSQTDSLDLMPCNREQASRQTVPTECINIVIGSSCDDREKYDAERAAMAEFLPQIGVTISSRQNKKPKAKTRKDRVATFSSTIHSLDMALKRQTKPVVSSASQPQPSQLWSFDKTARSHTPVLGVIGSRSVASGDMSVKGRTHTQVRQDDQRSVQAKQTRSPGRRRKPEKVQHQEEKEAMPGRGAIGALLHGAREATNDKVRHQKEAMPGRGAIGAMLHSAREATNVDAPLSTIWGDPLSRFAQQQPQPVRGARSRLQLPKFSQLHDS
jgi:hypothetical protein